MKKTLLVVAALLILPIMFTSCAKKVEIKRLNINAKEIQSVIRNFKEAECNIGVDDYNKYLEFSQGHPENMKTKLGKYTNSQGYNEIIVDRIPDMYRKACFLGKHTLQIEAITYKKYFQDSDNKKIGYEYTIKFQAYYVDTKKEVEMEQKGIVSLVNSNSEWKIYDDKIISMDKQFTNEMKSVM